MPPLPAFYDDLSLSLDEAWRLLVRGAADRHSPLHTPVVAGSGPDARVLVMRAADRTARQIRFHTDSRSTKVAALRRDPAVLVLGYHPGAKVQLRLAGNAAVHDDDAAADAAWARSTRFARRCYLATAAPGSASPVPTSGLPSAVEGREPEEEEIVPARSNFAVLAVTVHRIDWLYLAQAGHRRARFDWQAETGEWQGQWLVP